MSIVIATSSADSTSAAFDSVRSRLTRRVAPSDQRRVPTAEALHESERRLSVDLDDSTTSSAGRQRSRPDVHPRIERHET